MKITCYQSTEAAVVMQWLAYMDLGNCSMCFFGNTEAAARANAQRFFDREKARQLHLHGAASQVAGDVENLTHGATDNQQHRFSGKVWMLNRASGERARVDAGEVASFEARGYVRGGPRSK